MKAFYKFALTALFAIASTAVSAAPLGYSKISGSKFDVYYANEANYTASLSGTTLRIAPQSLSAAVTFPGGNAEFGSTLFIVAHDGVSLKSDFTQRFDGSFGLSPNSGFALEQVKFNVIGALYASDFASENVEYASGLGTSSQEYSQFGGDFPYFDTVDSNAPWFPGSNDSYNDGFSYNEFALGVYASVQASSPNGMGSFASIDNLWFTFETFETASDVPEPASLVLLGIGALALMRRHTRK